MLSKAHRLTDNKDFQNVYRRGRYNATALLSVNTLPGCGGETRIGVVVTKKVSKRANVRNAVKRKVREIARLSFPRLRSGQNVIISVRSGALAADYQTLEKDLLGSFKRLGLFTDDK